MSSTPSRASMLGVSTGELGNLANDIRTSAGVVQTQSKRVTDHMFGVGNDEAGRNYAQEGIAVHGGFETIGNWLRNWSEAATAIADSVGAAVVVYSTTVEEHAKQIAAAGDKK
ncbi:hypothetical protein [Nocardia sp. NBC_00403]|uniref:hypothetical protein n=1 Tax=Nocardia sp. NBC_00403 TaxID=2975990 RepID=UPI002E1D7F15